MSVTPKERIGRGLEQVRRGLIPFAEMSFEAHFGADWRRRLADSRSQRVRLDGTLDWDTYRVLKALEEFWGLVFQRPSLGKAERHFVGELLDWRNRHAHDGDFSTDDVDRMLDTARRLLRAIGASAQEQAVGALKAENQAGIEAPKRVLAAEAASLIEGKPEESGKPRETGRRAGLVAGLKVTAKVLRQIERAGINQAQIALTGFPPATKTSHVRCTFRMGGCAYALILGDAGACWRTHQSVETRASFDELFDRLSQQPDLVFPADDVASCPE